MFINKFAPPSFYAIALLCLVGCGDKEKFSALDSLSETPVAPQVNYNFQAPLQRQLEEEEALRVVQWPELVELRSTCSELKMLWKQGDLSAITNQLSSLTEKATAFAVSEAPADIKDAAAVMMYQKNLESMARSPRLNQTGQPEQLRMTVDGIDFLLRQIGKSAGLAEKDLL